MKETINDRKQQKIFLLITRLRNLQDYYPSWGHIENRENMLCLLQMSNFSKGKGLIEFRTSLTLTQNVFINMNCFVHAQECLGYNLQSRGKLIRVIGRMELLSATI